MVTKANTKNRWCWFSVCVGLWQELSFWAMCFCLGIEYMIANRMECFWRMRNVCSIFATICRKMVGMSLCLKITINSKILQRSTTMSVRILCRVLLRGHVRMLGLWLDFWLSLLWLIIMGGSYLWLCLGGFVFLGLFWSSWTRISFLCRLDCFWVVLEVMLLAT